MTKNRVSALAMATLFLAAFAGEARAQADLPPAHYICFYFTKPLPLMNFTIKGGGRYVDAGGKSGTYAFANGRYIFHGGNFDGQKAVFHPGNPPHIAFMSDRNAETETCQPGH